MPRKISAVGVTPSVGALFGEKSLSDLGLDTEGVVNLGEEEPEEPEEVLEVGSAEESEEEKPLTEGERETLDRLALTPHEQWVEELEQNNISPEEASRILDKVMSTGKYEETYKVGNMQFRLRTRSTVDADRTIEILQDQRPDLTGVFSHLIARINLASSLVFFAKDKFPHTSPTDENRTILDKEWRSRYRYCSSLPAPTFFMLSQVLQRFDQKVSLACDARSLENF